MNKQPCVYILSSLNRNVLYVGVTSNLPARIWQHKNKVVEGFTAKYHVNRLVYFEFHSSMEEAILREKFSSGGDENGKRHLFLISILVGRILV